MRRADDSGIPLAATSPNLSTDLVHPLSGRIVTHFVRRLGRRLGIDVTAHQLRHYAATQLISQGHDVRTVAGRLGHRDAAVTLKTYAAVLPARDRDAAAALGSGLAATS